ncbi:LOX3.1 [Symbiodinium sp. CCMP2592]|nr:LOX3.1 [Symbiodinium sp. CCMP2592]
MLACNVNVPFDGEKRRRCLKIAVLGLGACSIWSSWPSGGFVNSATSAPRGEIHSRASDLRVTLPAAAVLDLGSAPAEPSAVQILVPLLCAIIPVAYWWYVLVPFKRRELASSKRKGDMKEYLQDLATAPVQERKPEKWLFDKYLREAKLIEAGEASGLPKAVQTVEAGLQQQLPGGNAQFVRLSLSADPTSRKFSIFTRQGLSETADGFGGLRRREEVKTKPQTCLQCASGAW